ncbi:hypothetical protein EVAR_74622_1 [Eumeta japonica]|uniref:Uncharacterized protein n=1 Tax=Eumeta variegata TaxID=151549 RepID=A0A4C1WDA6_EUMVA|nr:hypothetical protein EVAR_74622_1 [Eumeta japonica]
MFVRPNEKKRLKSALSSRTHAHEFHNVRRHRGVSMSFYTTSQVEATRGPFAKARFITGFTSSNVLIIIDDLREGCYSTATTEDNISGVWLMMETDRRATCQQIWISLPIVRAGHGTRTNGYIARTRTSQEGRATRGGRGRGQIYEWFLRRERIARPPNGTVASNINELRLSIFLLPIRPTEALGAGRPSSVPISLIVFNYAESARRTSTPSGGAAALGYMGDASYATFAVLNCQKMKQTIVDRLNEHPSHQRLSSGRWYECTRHAKIPLWSLTDIWLRGNGLTKRKVDDGGRVSALGYTMPDAVKTMRGLRFSDGAIKIEYWNEALLNNQRLLIVGRDPLCEHPHDRPRLAPPSYVMCIKCSRWKRSLLLLRTLICLISVNSHNVEVPA